MFHFVDINGFNKMLIKGRTKVTTRCDLECVKVSVACRTLLLKGDVKGSQTPSVLYITRSDRKQIDKIWSFVFASALTRIKSSPSQIFLPFHKTIYIDVMKASRRASYCLQTSRCIHS